MDDLISRAAAIEIASGYCHPANIAEELGRLPSADAVEVVRCRDCEHYFTSNLEMAKNHGAECTMMNRRTMPEDYCSYGKREH